MHPFYKTLLKCVAEEREEMKQFTKFLINDFDHSLLEFDPIRTVKWIDLLNTTFISFALDNTDEAEYILETLIVPTYPILDESFSVASITNEILKVESFDDLKLSSVLDKQVLEIFHDKLEILLGSPDEKIEEFTSFFKITLWDGRRSIKITDKSFRYHYAFLLNVPFEDLRFVTLPDPNDFDNLQNYLINFAKFAYEQLMEHSAENVKIALGKVLPNVYDRLSIDKNYDEVIEEFVKHDELYVDTQSFINRVTKSCGNRNGIKNFTENQVAFLEMTRGDLDVLKFFYEDRPESIADRPRIESVFIAYEWAVVSNQTTAAEYLHEQVVEHGKYNYARVLVKSAEHGNLAAVEHFLDHYNVRNSEALKMAIIAAAKNDHYEVIKVISDKRPSYRGGLSDALYEASARGNSITVEYLLKTFPLIIERDVVSAFHAAVDSHNVKTVEKFIRIKTDNLEFSFTPKR